MYKTVPEAVAFARELIANSDSYANVDILICPPYTALHPVSEELKNSNVKLGAQNLHYEEEGAFTGEVSAAMIKSAGCDYVIVGHSERRQYFGETDSTVNKRLKRALVSGLLPIMCVGETLDQRKAGKTEQVVDAQIRLGLDGITLDDVKKITIAYEPVWAIGTGETATPEQADDVHRYIRQLIAVIYDKDVAENIRIQYGGSVKPNNARELLSRDDIDGALIGGASLKVDSFTDIIKIASSL